MNLRGMFVFFLLFIVRELMAQEQATQMTGVADSLVPRPIVDHLYLDYFTTYHGPTINNVTSPNSIDNTGRSTPFALSGLDSEITTAYLIDKERAIGIGPDIPFVAEPTQGGQFLIGDVGIKAFDKKTIKTDNFRLYTNFYVQAPTSAASQARHMDFALKTTPYMYYDIPDSRFRVGAWTEFKWYADVTTDKILKAYAAPYVSYRLTEKFLLSLEYEMEAHHNVGNDPMQFVGYQNDFQPGFIYRITRETLINPYLQFFPSTPLATNTTAIGVVFYSVLL